MTLKELFTSIANAIRTKTGGTAAIKAENFPAAIEAIKTGAENVVEFAAPKGRMKGDVDGDGFVTLTDYDLIKNNASSITNEIDFWCADVTGDGKINVIDYTRINQYLLGINFGFLDYLADYYSNWTYVKETDTSGYFYKDIEAEGMTAASSAFLLASDYSDCFIGVECNEGFARIKAERLPLADTDCLLVWEADGKEWEDSNGGFKTVYIDIPLGRMKGDIDGDGVITSADYDLALAHTKGTLITDTIALWCADINGDGSVKTADYLQINAYLNNSGSTLTKTPLMADYYSNWTYMKVDDLSGYFYRDISIAGMTANSTAILLVSNYEDCFIGVECLEGVVRIKASSCPVGNCKGAILWKVFEQVKLKAVVSVSV